MRMIIVSNRLPVVLTAEDSEWHAKPGSGGLITAMQPILRRSGGVWVGWTGTTECPAETARRVLQELDEGFAFEPVELTPAEQAGFYQGFSNEIIWPLFHDMQTICNFQPEYWETYLQVNRKFAQAVCRVAEPGDFLWVQDYHLMALGRELRQRGLQNRLGFFLHVPFPPPDIFRKLPWRQEVLEGLLAFDLVGFQTVRDQRNFTACLTALLPRSRPRRHGNLLRIEHAGGMAQVGTFPISIDYQAFARGAASVEVEQASGTLRSGVTGKNILLGLDRLDYTKGIPYRLRAFALALQRYPELHRNVTLFQIVVPSRVETPKYQEQKAEIERLVGEVNGAFTDPGWIPIHHMYRSIDRAELLAYYRAADVAFITPLKDGMNLVAKEYCACQVDGNGVLILSEFAGAADELRPGALVVNPYDVSGVADTVFSAVHMDFRERQRRMRRVRRTIREHDVFWWLRSFLEASGAGITFETAAPAV